MNLIFQLKGRILVLSLLIADKLRFHSVDITGSVYPSFKRMNKFRNSSSYSSSFILNSLSNPLSNTLSMTQFHLPLQLHKNGPYGEGYKKVNKMRRDAKKGGYREEWGIGKVWKGISK